MIIESERLILRKFRITDLDTLLKYRNDPLVRQYDGWKQHLSHEAGKKFIEEMRDMELTMVDNWIQIAFEHKEANLHIGDCGIRRFDEGRQAEIGIRIDSDYWKQGFAFEGLSAIFSYLFKKYGVHRIIANADTRNENSINLLTKLGMRKEGHSIESYDEKGEWTDEYHFAILQREWLS